MNNQTRDIHLEEIKKGNMNKKLTHCSECARTFWYVDPRPGGRPRQKCGICSSRPPRYPWGFVNPDQPDASQDAVFIPDAPPEASNSNPIYSEDEKLTALRYNESETDVSSPPVAEKSQQVNHTQRLQEELMNKQSTQKISTGSKLNSTKGEPNNLQTRLDELTLRLDQLEEQISEIKTQAITRSDWVDLSARLDIVEQNTNVTLGKVRNRLDGFTKEVRQIAVVPERELHEMFDLVRLIRHYLAPEKNGNQ